MEGFAGPGMIPLTQSPANPPVANNIPKSGAEGGKDALFRPLLGSMMTDNEHDMLTKFLKLKSPIFLGSYR